MTAAVDHPMTPTNENRSWIRHFRRVRVRVMVGYVALLLGALVTSTLLIRQVLISRVQSDIDRELAQEVGELSQLVEGNDPRTGERFGGDIQAIFDTYLARNVPSDGEAFYTVIGGQPYLISSGGPPELLEVDGIVARWSAQQSPGYESVQTAAGEARTLVVPILSEGQTAGVFTVAIFTADALADVARAVRIVALVGGSVLLLTSALAWSMAGRVVRPVRELTMTARLIGEHDLSARIPVQGDDELAELGRTFNEMLDRLDAGFTTQRRVIDDVAHELRTPITIVRGHLEMMDQDPEMVAATTALVLDELDRMSRYVADLLTVAKAEQPDFLHLGVVDLGEMVENLSSGLAALADRTWVVESIPAGPSAVVVADEHRLVQALMALATNAVQHTGPGDRIGLGAVVDARSVAMWIRDEGPGIDDADKEHLFDRLARGAGNRARRPEGSGLGLAIVAAIARSHGGDASVESEAGHGATFTVIIPRRRPRAGLVRQPALVSGGRITP